MHLTTKGVVVDSLKQFESAGATTLHPLFELLSPLVEGARLGWFRIDGRERQDLLPR